MENDPSKINRYLFLFLVLSLLLNIVLLVFIGRHFQITVALKPKVPAQPTVNVVAKAVPPTPVSTRRVNVHKIRKASIHSAPAPWNACPTPVWKDGLGSGLGNVQFPLGVAADKAGNIYLADNNNKRLEVFIGRTGEGVGTADTPAMASPWGLALDGKGHLLVADNAFNRVEEFDVSTPSRPRYMNIAFGNPGLKEPAALTLDDQGDLLVADKWNVKKFRWNGETWNQVESATMGMPSEAGSGPNQFSEPSGITTHGKYVYVSDSGNDRIQRWVREGNNGAGLDRYHPDPALANATAYQEPRGADPRGICLDATGRYLHVVTMSNWHQVFDTARAPWVLVSACSDSMNGPFGIAVDSSNNSYIACYVNNTFMKFGPASRLATPASQEAPGSTSGN